MLHLTLHKLSTLHINNKVISGLIQSVGFGEFTPQIQNCWIFVLVSFLQKSCFKTIKCPLVMGSIKNTLLVLLTDS